MTAHPLIPTHSPSSRIFQDANNFSMPGPNIFNNISASPPQPPDLTTYNCRPQTHTRPASSRWVESEVYARQMLPRGNGFPLWRPKLNNSSLPSIYQEEGVQIGDLGIITRAGAFDYLFNVCHDASHPLNECRVPEGFKPIQHLDSTVTDTQELPRGHWVPSHPSNVRLAGVIPYCPLYPRIEGVPDEVGGGLSFRSEASKGALLVLPEGGIKVDHLQLNKFQKYAAEQAYSWYDHVVNNMGREAINGSLYLVTGYDKTRAWGVSTFEYAEEGSVAMDFVPKKPQERNFPEYWFPRCDSAVSSNGTDDQYGNKSGCVFLRGFKIAIRSSLFRINCEVTCISDLDVEGLLPKPAIAWSSVPGRLLSIFLRSNSSQEHEYSDRDHITSYKHGVYHPSDVINQLLLDNDDKLDVAITHDDDWASVTRDNEDMPQNDELIRRIRNFHVQSMQSGGITYGCYSTPPRPLTDQVSNNIPPFNPAPLTTATQVDCDPSSSNDAKCKNSSQKPDDLSFGEIDSQTEIHIGEVEMVDRTGCSGGVFNPSKSPRKRKYSDGSDYSMFNAEVHTEEGKIPSTPEGLGGSSSNEVPLSPPLPSQEKPGPSDSKRLSISRSPSPPPPLPRITHRSIDKEETPRQFHVEVFDPTIYTQVDNVGNSSTSSQSVDGMIRHGLADLNHRYPTPPDSMSIISSKPVVEYSKVKDYDSYSPPTLGQDLDLPPLFFGTSLPSMDTQGDFSVLPYDNQGPDPTLEGFLDGGVGQPTDTMNHFSMLPYYNPSWQRPDPTLKAFHSPLLDGGVGEPTERRSPPVVRHSPDPSKSSYWSSEDLSISPSLPSVDEFGDRKPKVMHDTHQTGGDGPIRQRRNSKGRFECPTPHCGKSYTASHNLQSHIDREHLGKPSMYICDYCGRNFTGSRAHKRHMHSKNVCRTSPFARDAYPV